MTERVALELLRKLLVLLGNFATLDRKVLDKINEALRLTRDASND